MQPYVLAISLLLMIAVAAAFWWAVRNSAVDAQGATTGQVESYRAGFFWALVGFGVVIAFATLRPWPYDASAAEDTVIVTATGSQWS